MRFAAAIILASALSALAQGTVIFDNNVPAAVMSPVFYTDVQDTHHVQYGNGPSGFPPGNTDWSGYNPLLGPEFSAQLYAAPGADVPQGSLIPASGITYFKMDEPGFVVPMVATLAGVPADSAAATLQLRVWKNHGGRITRWEDAEFGATGNFFSMGQSRAFNVFNIGGSVNPPPTLNGLTSFNMWGGTLIPEPSSVSLLGLGAAALVIRRRSRNRHRDGKQR